MYCIDQSKPNFVWSAYGWGGGGRANVCSRHLGYMPLGQNIIYFDAGHMTKMAIMSIHVYGKKPSKVFFSGTGGPISTKLGM